MSTDFMEQMRAVFRAEALDLLAELDSALLTLEAEPGDTELVHRVFRAIHTIKGSGATAGFLHLSRFAHKMEEAFDLARDGRLEVTPDLIDCGLKACDVIRLILECDADAGAVKGEAEVASAFAGLVPTVGGEGDAGETKIAAPQRLAAFSIQCKPNRRIFYSGSDPATLLEDLRRLGQVHVTAHMEDVPPLSGLDAELCYLWWDILLITASGDAAIREVFIFVEDECELTIRLRADQEADIAFFGSVPAEAFDLFAAECEDHLESLEIDALALERDPSAKENLDSLFRGFHSIKGNAGLLLGHVTEAPLSASHPMQQLQRLAHGIETLLEPFRGKQAAPVSGEVVQAALETCDAIRELFRTLIHQDAAKPVSQTLLARLGISGNSAPAHSDAAWREEAFQSTSAQCMEMISTCFQLLEDRQTDSAQVLQTYLRGVQTLSAAARYGSRPEVDAPLAKQLLILDAAVRAGTGLTPEARGELERAFEATRAVLTGGKNQTSPPVGAAAAPATKQAAEQPSATIRIEQSKLDRLMRIVGELLVARGAFPPLIQRLQEGSENTGIGKDLKEAGSNISRIAEELQSSVMSIRMLPIKTVFQRFPRLIRDLARSLGKEVRLVMEGEGIELDKTILEQIGDPLVHVIRNAVDHGLETPEARRAAGKDPSGQLTLRARQEAGGVTIEVTDDGKGLDAEALKRKAVAKGLLTQDEAAVMSEDAAFQLLFLPGLSTAAKVTDVSGRGVGMDVVRSNVRNLHGSIEIRSKLGAGASFLIRLPASLMISKGILFEAGGQEYILPLHNIRDMVKLPFEETHEFQGIRLAQVRGTVYTIFSLAELLGLRSKTTSELSVAIVEAGTVRYGLAVDRFVNEVEVLVKPLTGGLERCREFQGAAILGDGRVVLVLNARECHRLERAVCD